jgi:hypothetical protein
MAGNVFKGFGTGFEIGYLLSIVHGFIRSLFVHLPKQ